MPYIVTLPDNFPYVALAASSTFGLNLYQVLNVSKARKAAGINYPQVYAEKAETVASKEAMIFNCAQRAHANTLEHLPNVLFGTVLVGLRYPIVAASLCGIWVGARVLYTIGYTTGTPANRNAYGGLFASLSQYVLGLAAIGTAVQMILTQ